MVHPIGMDSQWMRGWNEPVWMIWEGYPYFTYPCFIRDKGSPLVVKAKIQSHNSIVDAMRFPYNLYSGSWIG
jgi:hypothetical protein